MVRLPLLHEVEATAPQNVRDKGLSKVAIVLDATEARRQSVADGRRLGNMVKLQGEVNLKSTDWPYARGVHLFHIQSVRRPRE